MNKTTIYSTAIVSAIAVLSILAFSSSQVEAEPPFSSICPAENVQHWTMGDIRVRNNQIILVHDELPTIEQSTDFDTIFMQVNPDEVLNGNQTSVDRLNELGYRAQDIGDPSIERPVELGDTTYQPAFGGLPFSHSTICAEN